jgi:predicted MPP superfamily phosphohydrolase
MKTGLSRRQFGKIALKTGIGAGLLVAVDGFAVEPHFRLTTERVDINLQRLPQEFEGFRIVQLSDIHFGPNVGRKLVARCLDVTRELKPDLVVLTGDFVAHPFGKDHGPEGAHFAEPCADVLITFKDVPQLAILGNHDHWNDANIVHHALAERGITVLRNSSTVIERSGKRLWIAGIDDAYEGKADLPVTLVKVPRDETTILLAHEPDYADYAVRFPIDFQISGHSHGGQVRLPGIGPLILPDLGRKYHTGYYRVGRLQLYTNTGIGVVNPPVRFFCPPEITLITLHSAPVSVHGPFDASRAVS